MGYEFWQNEFKGGVKKGRQTVVLTGNNLNCIYWDVEKGKKKRLNGLSEVVITSQPISDQGRREARGRKVKGQGGTRRGNGTRKKKKLYSIAYSRKSRAKGMTGTLGRS